MNAETQGIVRYCAPFAVWIGLQSILPATAWAYAVRSAATACVALLLFPPRAGRRAKDRSIQSSLGHAALGLLGGLVVLVLWVAPEASIFYRTWMCWPIGSPPVPSSAPSPYDPALCGWPLTLVKLLGSAFVIAPVEEIFFRSFLYRWLQRRDFQSVPPSRFDASAFLWMVFLFTLEHDRPLAAACAGAIYGLLAIRCGLGSAIVAHVTTNLLLAVHVILHQAWAFW